MDGYEMFYIRTTGRIAILPAGPKGMNAQLRLTNYTADFDRLERVAVINDNPTLELLEQTKRRGGRRRQEGAIR